MASVAARHFLAMPAYAVVHALSAEYAWGKFFDARRDRRRLLGGGEKHEVGALAAHGKRFKRFTQARCHLIGRLELGWNFKLVRRLFNAQSPLLGLNGREHIVQHEGRRGLGFGHGRELHPPALYTVGPRLAQQRVRIRNQRAFHKRKHEVVFESAQNEDVAALVGVAGLAPFDFFDERSLKHQCSQKLKFGVPARGVF